MGVFDPNYKRLGLLIGIFVFLTMMYTGEAILLNPENTISYESETTTYNKSYYETEATTREQSVTLGDNLFSFLTFITFTSPAISDWAKPFFAIPVTIILMIGIYLAIDIAYDIIKALPFT